MNTGVKRLEREAEHSLPSGVEVKNKWSYINLFINERTIVIYAITFKQ
jgi:hypothetical protein